MDIHEWAERLQTTVAGFARLAGISRATANSWRADPDKTYAATPRPQTLLDMADSLEQHGEEAMTVAVELRQAAGDPVVLTVQRSPDDFPERHTVRVDSFKGDGVTLRGKAARDALLAHGAAVVDLSRSDGAGKRRKKPATEV